MKLEMKLKIEELEEKTKENKNLGNKLFLVSSKNDEYGKIINDTFAKLRKLNILKKENKKLLQIKEAYMSVLEQNSQLRLIVTQQFLAN